MKMAQTGKGAWIVQLARELPESRDSDTTAYRRELTAALADLQLNERELSLLQYTARRSGLSFSDLLIIHEQFMRQLIIEAWLSGGEIPPHKREQLVQVAELLGVESLREVRSLQDPNPPAGETVFLFPGAHVAFAGQLEFLRLEWERVAMRAGLCIDASVNPDTTVLVSHNGASRGMKAAVAADYGIPEIAEVTFAMLLGRIMPEGAVAVSAPASEPNEGAEIFPWASGGSTQVADRTPTGIAKAWIARFPGRPLHELSPLLTPDTHVETASTYSSAYNHWTKKFPRLLEASAADLADLRGVGATRRLHMVTAVVLAAIDIADARGPAALSDGPTPGAPGSRVPTPGSRVSAPGAPRGRSALGANRAPIAAGVSAVPAPAPPAPSRYAPMEQDGGTRSAASSSALLAEMGIPADAWLLRGWFELSGMTFDNLPPAIYAIADVLGFTSQESETVEHLLVATISSMMRVLQDDPRLMFIIIGRAFRGRTLEEIGRELGITRERVRQLEGEARQRIKKVTLLPALSAQVSRLSDPVRQIAEIYERFPSLSHPAPGIPGSYLEVIGSFTDDWKLSDGWIVARDFPDRLSAALSNAEANAPYGVTHVEDLAVELAMAPAVLRAYLLEYPKVRVGEQGHVFTRVGTHAQRAAGLLYARHTPLTAEEMSVALGAESLGSLKNALSADRRFMRVSTDQWALREWGGEEYTTIADWLDRRVQQGGGRVALRDLLEEAATLRISPNSVRTYASTGRFDLTDGEVRYAQSAPPGRDPGDARGLYLREGQWHLLVTVTEDMLRGASVVVPRAVAALYEAESLEQVELSSDFGPLTLSAAHSEQAALSPLGVPLCEAGAQPGDRFWLRFDSDYHLELSPAAPLLDAAEGITKLYNDMALEPPAADPGDVDALVGPLNLALGLPADASRQRTIRRLRRRRQDWAATFLAGLP